MSNSDLDHKNLNGDKIFLDFNFLKEISSHQNNVNTSNTINNNNNNNNINNNKNNNNNNNNNNNGNKNNNYKIQKINGVKNKPINNNNNNDSGNNNYDKTFNEKKLDKDGEFQFYIQLQNNLLRKKNRELTNEINKLKEQLNNKETNDNYNGNGNIDNGKDEYDEINFEKFLNYFKQVDKKDNNKNNNNKNSIEEFCENEQELIQRIDEIFFKVFKQIEDIPIKFIERSNSYYFLLKIVRGFTKKDKALFDEKKVSNLGIKSERNLLKKKMKKYIDFLKMNIKESELNYTQENNYNEQFKELLEKELDEKRNEYFKLLELDKDGIEDNNNNNDDDNDDEKAIKSIVKVETSNKLKEKTIEYLLNKEILPNELNNETILSIPKKCYICKMMYRSIHHFYHKMCTSCGDFNFEKRFNTFDLNGRVALVTGGRIKIGYEIVLKLLRSGATVIVTSRFPKDAAIRFSIEHDFKNWSNRLHLYALNLTNLKSLELFCSIIKKKFPAINIIINNAAQTVKRPSKYYDHQLLIESKPLGSIPSNCIPLLKHFEEIKKDYLNNDGIVDKDILGLESSQISNQDIGLIDYNKFSLSLLNNSIDDFDKSGNKFIDPNQFDKDGQSIDNRESNSWVKQFQEVPFIELLESHAISSFSPFIMMSYFYQNLIDSTKIHGNAFIINVSAMEGVFNRTYKSANHPHTNMAKASQNMFTRTCSLLLSVKDIYMNSCDTGWVTFENPNTKKEHKEPEKEPPLDEIDGASRVLDPIFTSLKSNEFSFGNFYKDYKKSNW